MNEIKKTALHTIDAHANTFTAISDAIWDEPELSLKEFKAAALYTDALEKLGILPDAVESAGKAALLLDRLNKRRDEGLTTPKQIRCLEKYGFQHVGTWSFEAARHMIDRIAAQGWRGVPKGVNPRTYTPAAEPPAADSPFDFGW